MENLLGVMEDIIKDNGKIILCMEMGNFVGKMGKYLKVIMKMIKNKEKVNLLYKMELYYKRTGLMENFMELLLY